jgi:hypothetical protein
VSWSARPRNRTSALGHRAEAGLRRPGSGKVAAWAVSAVGPSGEAAMAMGIGEANAIRQLAGVLRGELAVSEAWAPIL